MMTSGAGLVFCWFISNVAAMAADLMLVQALDRFEICCRTVLMVTVKILTTKLYGELIESTLSGID